MNRIITFLIIVSIAFSCKQKNTGEDKLPQSFQILPKPKKVEILAGGNLDSNDLVNIKMEGSFERPVMGEILGRLIEKEEGGGTLILKIDSSENIPESEEGYILTIKNGGAKIVSRGEPGLFYGCQTLEQLLEDARDFNTSIPVCKITDFPDYSYRSVHFDLKHHLDHINVYYESIDWLAKYKINSATFEFEDKLRYRRQPLVGAPQAISIDEMAALTKYARKRNIEITPLVQGLGHASFILKYPEYAKLREVESNRWVFCPKDDGTYKVLFDMYLDAMDATPGSKYFHIGGDEIGNIGICPRCKPFADKYGTFELNLYWFNKVCDFLIDHGRIPIFWDDMPFKYAGVWATTRLEKDNPELWVEGEEKLNEVIDKFPEKGVFMHWNYTTCRQPGNERSLKWLTDNNRNTMVSTAVQSSAAALFPKDERTGKMSDRGLVAIKSSLKLAHDKGITGMLSTAWDDRSPHLETYRRGFIASAEFSWNTGGRTLDEFQKAYMQREFGPGVSYTNLYFKLRDAARFWETSLVKTGNRMDPENALFTLPGLAHWLTEPEEKKEVDPATIIIELPDIKNPGKWSKKYKARLDEAEKLVKIYKSTSPELKNLEEISAKNRYHWQVFSAVNDFQITAPKLLLALKQCDVDDKDARKKGFETVKNEIKNFNLAWENLKNVYSETRFISYPPNYFPDRYFHFASQREDLTWMIQVEEILHPEIEDWLNDFKF